MKFFDAASPLEKFIQIIGFCAIAACLIAALVPSGVVAQTATGEADVRVLDPSGSVISGAKVEIAGAQNGNVARAITTNSTGVAVATFLQPGAYDVTVSAPGFDSLVQRGVVIHVGQTINITVTLQTGRTTESVTVTGESPQIEQKSSTLAQVTEEKQILGLPLNGRNYLDLANLAAGTVPSKGSRDNSFSAYGNTGLQNAFLLDGARNDNYLRGLDNRSRDMVRPPLDAINEFTVQTSNYSAEFGASAGGVVNVVTKSGTNRLHGTAYDYLRNDNLDAANFFAVAGHKPLLVQNQYGGSLGGPLVRNRAWLFGAYEGLHERSESAALSTVPTPALRNGIFGSTVIYDPYSLDANGRRTVFPGNRIQASQFNATGAALLAWYPLPNLPGTANNYASNPSQVQSSHNSILRGDVQVSDKDSMFARLAIIRNALAADSALPLPAQTPVDRSIDSEGLSYGYTRTFTPTLVNEFRFSWTRLVLSQDATQPRNEVIPGSLDPEVKTSTPAFTVNGYAGLGAQPGCCGNSPLTKSSGVWDISDNISKSLSHHLLKMGVDVQAIRPSPCQRLAAGAASRSTGCSRRIRRVEQEQAAV